MKRLSLLALTLLLGACQNPQNTGNIEVEPEVKVAENTAQIELPPSSGNTTSPLVKAEGKPIQKSTDVAFSSFAKCVGGGYSPEQCRTALSTAQAMNEQQSPTFESLQLCQQVFSSCSPTPTTPRLFKPQMGGFSLGGTKPQQSGPAYYAPVYYTYQRQAVTVIIEPDQSLSLTSVIFTP